MAKLERYDATEDADELGDDPPLGKPHVLYLTHMRPGDHIELPRTAMVLDQWRSKTSGGVLVLWQVEADQVPGEAQ